MARKKNYLNNKDMMAQLILSKQHGKMTDEFCKMMLLLTQKYAKAPQYAFYSFNDDMQGHALLNLVRYWDRFDETKYTNCFAFYTQNIKNSFIQYLNKERTQRDIRDESLVEIGLNPSHNYHSQSKHDNDTYVTQKQVDDYVKTNHR